MKKFTQHLKVAVLMGLVALGMACPQQASAAEKNANVWCLKTNTGNYYAVLKVSMMVAVDKAETFEIVMKEGDGPGEAGVKSVSYEQHKVSIDFDKYKPVSEDATIDFTKKIYMLTNTGKYFTFTSLPTLNPNTGTDKFDVIFGSNIEKRVSRVWFYRGENPEDGFVGIKAPMAANPEKLTLMTPVGYQLQVSGCGEAQKAVVYSANGKQVAQAGVTDGVTTVQVGHLTKGVYVLKVGNKSLKFVKK